MEKNECEMIKKEIEEGKGNACAKIGENNLIATNSSVFEPAELFPSMTFCFDRSLVATNMQHLGVKNSVVSNRRLANDVDCVTASFLRPESGLKYQEPNISVKQEQFEYLDSADSVTSFGEQVDDWFQKNIPTSGDDDGRGNVSVKAGRDNYGGVFQQSNHSPSSTSQTAFHKQTVELKNSISGGATTYILEDCEPNQKAEIDRRFVCNNCGKCFSGKYKLKLYQIVQTGEGH